MIDERGGYEEPRKRLGVRTAVLAAWEMGEFGGRIKGPAKRLSSLGYLCRYAMAGGHSTKPRTPMDVPGLVDKWIEAIVGMSLAHDKDTFDAHDAKADDLLTPILAAPVRQVREFYDQLRRRMRSDKRVPMLVWMGFEAWGEMMVKDAPDQAIVRLENKLAAEIAELVEGPIADQIPGAIQRALRWRDPEQLGKVKEALESGAKPKLVGRQSCLFLEVGKGEKKVSVML